MIAGPGAPPIVLADPTEPAAQLPWAASPDGKTIAIVTGKGLWYQFSAPVSLALWLVSSDGTNARKIQDLLPPRGVDLTPGGDDAFNLVPALTSEQRLAWSPDGALVAFVSAHEGQVDLYSAALDGTVARLTDTPALEQGPAWSPDGALVAYRTTSGFGTGAGWGDIALAVSARGGGPPVFESSDRALAAGTQAAAIPDLLWLSPTLLVAGLWDSVAGSSEVRALDVAARTARVIFDAPYSALAWNGTTGQLAIAGTSAQLIKRPIDGRKLAPGLFTWSPAAEQPTQIEPQPVERLAWTPQGDALAYSVAGAKPELRIWSIGAEGDVKPIAGAAAERLSWSPDGQRLAADMSAYSRAGQVLLDRAGQPGLQIGWTNQGLVYARNDGGSAFDLLVWDGAADQPLARQIAKPMAAGVVNPAP
jgi:dipeptidyl aminopeptidase/acylaminoacyl peptidase